jgi:2-oxoglutarate ferredoxin oxidoreductase subunit alpha
VAHVHLRHLAPFPRNLGELLARYDHVLVPEINSGQLLTMLRGAYLIPAEGLNRVAGRPFRIADVEAAIGRIIESADAPPGAAS